MVPFSAFLALAMVLFSSLSLVATRAEAAIYWGTVKGIARANLDGSEYEPEFLKIGSVCAIAVDSTHIYWASHLTDTIGRSNLEGTGIEPSFISPAGGLPCGVAVDSRYIYWPNMAGDTIGRSKLDGSEVDTSFMATAEHPCGVAVNQTGIYWSSDQEKTIWRTDIDGVNSPEVVVEKATEPCDLGLSDTHLFWSDGYTNQISRANLDGSEVIPGFITGGNYPRSLSLYGGHLYWLNVGWGYESIGRASLNGTDIDQRFRGISHQEYPYGLAVDSTQVVPRPPRVWAQSSFRIGKLRRMGSGAVIFPIELPGNGWLEVKAGGVGLSLRPETAAQGHSITRGPQWLTAGQKWLKIAPTKKRGDGSRCVLRVFRNGGRVKLSLNVKFREPDKQTAERTSGFLLFKPARKGNPRPKPRRRAISCSASPR